MSATPVPRLDRRTAIKWMLAATGVLAARPRSAFAADAPALGAKGYGTDPDLMREYQPGDVWPLTFNDGQRQLAAALCALIIPADEKSKSAAELHVHDFIDEWISAPYPAQQADREVILPGLAWIETEAEKRFRKKFVDLDLAQQSAIADDICWEEKSAPEFKTAAVFFRRFRDLTSGGFYTTPEGMADIGYIGNVPTRSFDGPSPEVIARLGLS